MTPIHLYLYELKFSLQFHRFTVSYYLHALYIPLPSACVDMLSLSTPGGFMRFTNFVCSNHLESSLSIIGGTLDGFTL